MSDRLVFASKLLLPNHFGRPGIVIGTVLTAVVVNLLVYAVGSLIGGSFVFTADAGAGASAHVDALTVAGFTAVPLAIGMGVAAAVSRRWPRLLTVGLAAAPIVAVGTIAVMTLPADFDTTSTITLALCHLSVAIAAVLGLLSMRQLSPVELPSRGIPSRDIGDGQTVSVVRGWRGAVDG